MMKKPILTLAILLLFCLPACAGKVDTAVMNLPDGIDAELQIIDDCHSFVVFTNNTGKDVSIDTTVMCLDEHHMPIDTVGTAYDTFLRSGKSRIEVIETRDPISFYQIECSVGEPNQNKYEDNEAISVDSVQNGDGSVTVSYHSTADHSIVIYATIFYTDAEGKILGYEHSTPQFVYDMGGTFTAPGFEYDSYYLEFYA